MTFDFVHARKKQLKVNLAERYANMLSKSPRDQCLDSSAVENIKRDLAQLRLYVARGLAERLINFCDAYVAETFFAKHMFWQMGRFCQRGGENE